MKKILRSILGNRMYTFLQRTWRLLIIPKLVNTSYQLRLLTRIFRPSLEEIGIHHGTDKANEAHSFAGKSFLSIYEKYLKRFRKRKTNFLEIGVFGGASLRTWRDYSTRWQIFGVDINPEAKKHETGRIGIEIGSQTDKKFLLTNFGSSTKFDVIVDDGSHVNSFTLFSFQVLFEKRLRAGGLYIIEDLDCSYYSLENVLQSWPGMSLNDLREDYVNKRGDMNSFFNELVKELDHERGLVEYIHFWSKTVIIKKVDYLE
ncbi:hypothetical protein ACFL1V_02465 [Pseudomonadota bacterium]